MSTTPYMGPPFNPDCDHRLPTELQLAILDFLPLDRPRRKFTQLLKTVALVCCEWRNWAWSMLFHNLEISSDFRALRALIDLCAASAESSRHLDSSNGCTYHNLGSFIRYIVVTIGQPTGHGMIELADLVSLLPYTPHLEDLALSIIQSNSVIRNLQTLESSTFTIPSLSSLRIRSYADTSKAVCLFVARCPALAHLSLELGEYSAHDPTGCSPPSALTSFRSLGCWDPSYDLLDYFVLRPSNTSLRALELHRSPSSEFLRQLAQLHGKRVESLTLRSMEPASTRTWESIIDQFTALRHLSVWCLPSRTLLQSVCTSDLRHFEFRRPWTYSYKDMAQLEDVAVFLKGCPELRAVTYHSTKPIEVIDKLISARGLARTWKENHYVDGYMEDPRDFQALPYSSWKAQAYPGPPLEMTKPRAPEANINGYDTSGWDLPIHSAKSDLFL